MKKTMAAVLSLALLSLGARAAVDKKTERTYKAKCASCHGADGKAETEQAKKMGIPSFASPAVQQKSEQQIKDAIANGMKSDKGEMEGYKDKLSSEEIDKLADLVKSFK